MDEYLGMLRVKVLKGSNLAVRDMLSSDPYVVLTLGPQVCSFTCIIQKILTINYMPLNCSWNSD